MENPRSIRFPKKIEEKIDVYRASKLPPLTFSEATRALIEMALKTEKSNEDD